MSTHNICFCGEIRKILCGYPLISVAMEKVDWFKVFASSVVLISRNNRNIIG